MLLMFGSVYDQIKYSFQNTSPRTTQITKSINSFLFLRASSLFMTRLTCSKTIILKGKCQSHIWLEIAGGVNYCEMKLSFLYWDLIYARLSIKSIATSENVQWHSSFLNEVIPFFPNLVLKTSKHTSCIPFTKLWARWIQKCIWIEHNSFQNIYCFYFVSALWIVLPGLNKTHYMAAGFNRVQMGAWNIQRWGRAGSAHRLHVKHNLRGCLTSHQHMIVSHCNRRGTSHVVWVNYIQVDHTVFTTNHICATVAVGHNLSIFLFARFILSQCDSPISHIGSAVNPGFRTQKQLLDFISGGFVRSRWHCSPLSPLCSTGRAELSSPGI